MDEELSSQSNEALCDWILATDKLAIYALAAHFCEGRNVLHLAYGDSSGSLLMAESTKSIVWSIDSPDQSDSSVTTKFIRENVNFLSVDVRNLHEWNTDNIKFDVLVWTDNAMSTVFNRELLDTVKSTLKPDAVILLITRDNESRSGHCYSKPDSSNPFHIESINEAASSVFGQASQCIHVRQLADTAENDIHSHNDGTHAKLSCRFIQNESYQTSEPGISREIDDSNISFSLGLWNARITEDLVTSSNSCSQYRAMFLQFHKLMQEHEGTLQEVEKLNRQLCFSNQRIDAIRRISAFEYQEHRNREFDALEAAQSKHNDELNRYKSLVHSYSISRAHRIAALYTRSADRHRNPIMKLLAFFRLGLRSFIRALMRKVHR